MFYGRARACRLAVERWAMLYGQPAMQFRNVPSGWAAFRVLRQTLPKFVRRRHGNWKHGDYSKGGIADRRQLRVWVRVLWGRALPPPEYLQRAVPSGWSAYRGARLAAERPRSLTGLDAGDGARTTSSG